MSETSLSKSPLLPSIPPDTTLLALQNISKYFRGVTALSRVSFSIGPGEVITLLGSNGAGKSTLLKILCGLLQPDTGELQSNGRLIRFHTPKEAATHGIRLVTQEPELFDDLSLLENVALSLEKPLFKAIGPITKNLRNSLPRLLADTDPTITIDSDVRALSLSQRQVLALLSTVAAQPRLLLLDEPTASLSEEESVPVIRTIKRAISKGSAVVLATHRPDLVNALAHRVLVLRDGLLVEDLEVTDHNRDQVRAYITPRFTRFISSVNKPHPKPALEVASQEVNSRTSVPLVVYKGESLGLIGNPLWQLSTFLRRLAGIQPGKFINIGRSPYTFCSPKGAISRGIIYVPSDRQYEGIFANLSIAENLLIAIWAQRSSLSIVSKRKLTDEARALSRTLPISSSDLRKSAFTLSGGNQQKVILSRLLALNPHVLILDNSTRGLDTFGRTDLAKTLAEFCSAGGACLVSASEQDYLASITHKIIELFLDVKQEGVSDNPP